MTEDLSLPAGWIEASLGSISEVRLGKMLSAKAREAGLVQMPYLRNENVRWGYVDLSDVKKMGFKPQEVDRYRVEPGDLLVCEGGEPGRAAIYSGPAQQFMYQKALHRVRVQQNRASARYVRYFFEHHAARLKTSQTTIAHFPLERMLELRVPLAPRSEQDRIVAEIEKQFTRLDAGVAALKRLRVHLRRYRAALLKTASEEQLVPRETTGARARGRDFESGAELLKRILAERRRLWLAVNPGKQYSEPLGPETKDLATLPEGWAWATAEQISDATRAITYGVIKLGDPVRGGTPTLRSSDVRSLRLDLSGVKCIAPEIAAGYKRTFLSGGEILVTVRGTLGGVVVASEQCKGFNVSREVAVIALVDSRLGPCLALFMASPLLQAWLKRRAKGIAYTGINIETLKEMPIPIPPLPEQQRIVSEVEAKLSELNAIAATVAASLGRSGRLRAAVLRAAFEGRLAAPLDGSLAAQ